MGKVGRPKGTNNKDTIISLRLDKDTKKALDTYCKRNHIRKSEALRQALDQLMSLS